LTKFRGKKTKETEQSKTRAFLRTGREHLPLDSSMLVCGSVLAAPNQSTHVYTTHSNPIQSIHSDSAQLLSPSSVTRQSINPDQTTYELDPSADLSDYNCTHPVHALLQRPTPKPNPKISCSGSLHRKLTFLCPRTLIESDIQKACSRRLVLSFHHLKPQHRSFTDDR
jgi:hypothetical protein